VFCEISSFGRVIVDLLFQFQTIFVKVERTADQLLITVLELQDQHIYYSTSDDRLKHGQFVLTGDGFHLDRLV
jgi:hypothetical protein